MNNTPPNQSPIDCLDIALWQWQSDPDPWAEKDPSKWTWQNYSDADCIVLEKAFSLNKAIVDLKGYEIDFKRMVQVNKQFRDRTRRVRRHQKSRFLIEIPRPVAIIKDQKTMNEAFGTIQHFLDYIMKRTPKAYELYQRLKTLKLDSRIHEFQDVIQEVVQCIEKGAELKEKVGNTRASFLSQSKAIINVIKENSTILRDFLKAILKVYTMETFLCYWLNELLRSENWEVINVLTPYLVCLVYTFKLSDFIVKYEKPQKLFKNLVGFVKKPKLCLYRGSALKKEHLELYNPKKVQYFSWNGVTSTSRDRNVALGFVILSLVTPKVGVLFSIETDFASIEDCEGMIDVSQGSQFPDEQEIILAPGTVFKLRKACLLEKNIYEINLKVTRKFKTKKVKNALLGTLQDQAIFKERAIIQNFPSPQSFKLLELLKGNKSIRRLEIINSELAAHTMEDINNVRLTTNVKKQDVKLRQNVINVSSLGLLAHYFSEEQLDEICSDNIILFKKGNFERKGGRLKALTLSRKTLDSFRNNNLLANLWESIKTESQITDLSLLGCGLQSNEIQDFLDCLKELKCLNSLSVSFSQHQVESKEMIPFFFKTIGSLRTLKQLSLQLILSSEGFGYLENSLLSLASLQSLSLKFFNEPISDEALSHLKSALTSLKSLQYLLLDFSIYSQISGDRLKAVLASLPSLQQLSLNLAGCGISNKGLDHLKTVLTSLTSLQYLYLDFDSCFSVSDEGLRHLKDGLLLLKSLQYLFLNFHYCKSASDEGLNHLKTALLSLTNLKHLSFDFGQCSGISSDGLSHLKNGLISLKSLQYLDLHFCDCDGISNQGLNHLKTALPSLTSLQDLSLDFGACRPSDEGLNHLKDGLRLLPSLQRLFLNFGTNSKISDEGLKHLKSCFEALKSLQYLCLNFSYCPEISDQGMNHLKDALISLTSLQELTLDFSLCDNISEKGLNHLKTALNSLQSLRRLGLGFDNCEKISSKAMDRLQECLTLPIENSSANCGYRLSLPPLKDFITDYSRSFDRYV